jgi:AbrB family looped-hinge helix DNA binding protein
MESKIESKVTSKGQVTIPKHIRDALKLTPGSAVEFRVGNDGNVVIIKGGRQKKRDLNRFERVRGTATVRWNTDELMALLRD